MFPNLKQLFSICIIFLFASLNGNELPLAKNNSSSHLYDAKTLACATIANACSSIKQKTQDMNMWYKNLTPVQQKTVLLLTGTTIATVVGSSRYISKRMENNRKEQRDKIEKKWKKNAKHVVQHNNQFFDVKTEQDREKLKQVIAQFPVPSSNPEISIPELSGNLRTLQIFQDKVKATLTDLDTTENELKKTYTASFWEGLFKFFSLKWVWIYPLFSKSNDSQSTALSIFKNNRERLEELKNNINNLLDQHHKEVNLRNYNVRPQDTISDSLFYSDETGCIDDDVVDYSSLNDHNNNNNN